LSRRRQHGMADDSDALGKPQNRKWRARLCVLFNLL
jgi:hypothetical protein